MVEKSFGFDVDAVMLDLEDGVVPALKPQARAVVSATLRARPRDGSMLRYVRVNGFETPELDADLQEIVAPGVDGLVMPKIERPADVRELDGRLALLERAASVKVGSIKLMLAIESAKGLVAAAELAGASQRVSGLIFGAEDFSRDIGLPTVRTGAAREFVYARSAIVVAAAASKIWSIDGVWPDLDDQPGLEEDSRLARALGFTGKSMIHPGQAQIVNGVFQPTQDEVDYSRRLIEQFEVAQGSGVGSIRFEGMLVDLPIYERACRTVRLATRADQNRGSL